MAGTVTVRAASPDDVARMAAWACAMARETEDKALDPDTVHAGIANALPDPRRARYFIAESEGAAVGTLMLTYEWSDWRNGEWWWIQSVYVDPAHRRRGVFRALYRHVEALARAQPGCRGLRLYVERGNAAAQATYLALGMADAGYTIMEAERPPAQ